jgi:hypothetical protein
MTTANTTRYLFTREALLGGFGLELTVTPVSGDTDTTPFCDADRWRWRRVAPFKCAGPIWPCRIGVSPSSQLALRLMSRSSESAK